MSDTPPKLSDILALERTHLAADRTLMAWLRTALAMISFGFTIYKFLQYLREEKVVMQLRHHGPRNLGLSLIGLGIFSLVIASIQHWRYVKKLNPEGTYNPLNLPFIVACIVCIIGLLAFFSILFRFGPFAG